MITVVSDYWILYDQLLSFVTGYCMITVVSDYWILYDQLLPLITGYSEVPTGHEGSAE